MTAPPEAGPTPAGLGARVVTLVGALAALLALALPWAVEDNTVTVSAATGGSATLLTRGGDRWTGWAIYGASRLNGHRPVALAIAVILITGTVLLVVAAWATFEKPRMIWLAPATAGVAVLVLVTSIPGLDGVPGRFGAGHVTSTEFGVLVWRLALILVIAGAARLAVLQEAARPGRRTYQ
jgi:hypothetical protein